MKYTQFLASIFVVHETSFLLLQHHLDPSQPFVAAPSVHVRDHRSDHLSFVRLLCRVSPPTGHRVVLSMPRLNSPYSFESKNTATNEINISNSLCRCCSLFLETDSFELSVFSTHTW